jgi:hypothetical protein
MTASWRPSGVRTMFTVYLLLIVAGLVYFSVLGLLHQ